VRRRSFSRMASALSNRSWGAFKPGRPQAILLNPEECNRGRIGGNPRTTTGERG
jgi:hypothetical protein